MTERLGVARFGSAPLPTVERQSRDVGDIKYLPFGQYQGYSLIVKLQMAAPFQVATTSRDA